MIDWRPLDKLYIRGPIPDFEFTEEFIIIKVLTKITIKYKTMMKCEVKSNFRVRLGAPYTPEAPGICPALSNGCYAIAYNGSHLSYQPVSAIRRFIVVGNVENAL